MDAQTPFSARIRRDTTPIDNEFPRGARTGLLHIMRDLIAKRYVEDWSAVAMELQRIGRLMPTGFSGERQAREEATELLLSLLSWEQAYNFCERLHSYLAQEPSYRDSEGNWVTTSISEVRLFIANELQRLFQEENLAYEFRDGIVKRRGRRHTVEKMAKAETVLADERLDSARKHFSKAQQLFRDREKPDPENAVKEAVCAVEAAAKDLFPDAKASTLDDMIKWLVSTGKLPPGIGKSYLGLYAFRGGGKGVSHGGADGGAATLAIAEYALATTASQIILLIELASAQEEVPF